MNSVNEYYRRQWNQIHSKAANSITPQQHSEYGIWIRDVATKLPCHVCKIHALQYIDNNPPENVANLFVWSWEFHNDVNLRLGKPLMDYASAAVLYHLL